MTQSPVVRSSVKLHNNEMEYFSFGSGKTPFVMLPGLSVKSLMNSAEGIAYAYRMFSDDFTVYCFERPKILSKNNALEQVADDTAEAMQLLSIKNACVFGTSLGGMLAQYLAINHPQLVSKLLLASTCSRLNPTANAVMADWANSAEKGDIDAFCDSFIDYLYGKEFAEKFGDLIKFAHKDVTKDDFERFIQLGRSCDNLNTYDSLDNIKCPTLVIGAKNDKVLTAEASVEIAEKLNCPLYLYGEEYGHCVFDEAPDYKQRIYDFFTEV